MLNLGKFILLYIALVVLQVLVINELHLCTLITPYIYVMLILQLPFRLREVPVLLLSLLLGFSFDGIEQTWGLQAAACVAAAHTRNMNLRRLKMRLLDDYAESLSLHDLKPIAYLRYVLEIVLVYNMVLFVLESFSLLYVFHTLAQILLNTFVSTCIIFGLHSLFRNRIKEEGAMRV